MAVRTLIAEDEPLARETLRAFVSETGWLSLVGEATDGRTAARLIDELRPDLVLLDVQMPELSGVEALMRARHEPAVVFTTAHDSYAVAAFELGALDYLLKPFGRERFNRAMERVRARLAASGKDDVSNDRPADMSDDQSAASSAVAGASDTPAADEPAASARGAGGVPSARERAASALACDGPLTRLFVRERGRIVHLRVEDVSRFEADDDYARVHAAGRTHLLHLALGEIERRLDPARFLRVHRSHLVNLDHVQSIEPSGRQLLLRMRDGSEVLASRSGSQLLRELIN